MKLWKQMVQAPVQIASGNFHLGELLSGNRRILIIPAAIAMLETYQWLDARRPVHSRLLALGDLATWGFYYALGVLILVFGVFGQPGFIYFGF